IKLKIVLPQPPRFQSITPPCRGLLTGESPVLLNAESRFDWFLLLLMALVLTAGYGVVVNVTYKTLIVCLVVLGAISVVLAGASGIRWGFLLWIGTLAIGYRTFPVTPALTLHPGELVLWALLLWLITCAAVNRRVRAVFWLPTWLWMFLPFCVWGWIAGAAHGLPWDRMLAEMRDFLLLIPLYIVASTTIVNQTYWLMVVSVCFLIAI